MRLGLAFTIYDPTRAYVWPGEDLSVIIKGIEECVQLLFVWSSLSSTLNSLQLKYKKP